MELYFSATPDDAETVVVKNSEPVQLGAFYHTDETGAIESDAVSDYPKGLVIGFKDANGAALGSGYETQTNSTYTSAGLMTAAADNTTVDKIRVHGRLIFPEDVFSGELDDTIATTTGSGTPGYFIAMSTSAAQKLDENTATGTKSGNTPFILVDNGQGENSAQDPIRRGNFVLFKVAHIQDLSVA